VSVIETATFGTGCFWCTEAAFQQMKGILTIVSGYAGGHTLHPTYHDICTGTTNHAECIQIEYDASVIRYEELLNVFWLSHDPTTLNRQGNDVGTQYRSVIFYNSDKQHQIALASKAEMTEKGIFENPIVTEISPLGVFYPAEDYHQNYYDTVGHRNPYCAVIITPKLQKLRKQLIELELLK